MNRARDVGVSVSQRAVSQVLSSIGLEQEEPLANADFPPPWKSTFDRVPANRRLDAYVSRISGINPREPDRELSKKHAEFRASKSGVTNTSESDMREASAACPSAREAPQVIRAMRCNSFHQPISQRSAPRPARSPTTRPSSSIDGLGAHDSLCVRLLSDYRPKLATDSYGV